jgi:hypothetical protein
LRFGWRQKPLFDLRDRSAFSQERINGAGVHVVLESKRDCLIAASLRLLEVEAILCGLIEIRKLGIVLVSDAKVFQVNIGADRKRCLSTEWAHLFIPRWFNASSNAFRANVIRTTVRFIDFWKVIVTD